MEYKLPAYLVQLIERILPVSQIAFETQQKLRKLETELLAITNILIKKGFLTKEEIESELEEILSQQIVKYKNEDMRISKETQEELRKRLEESLLLKADYNKSKNIFMNYQKKKARSNPD